MTAQSLVPASRLLRYTAVATLLALCGILASLGCGGTGKSSLSGKVTLKGSGVTGDIILIGADKKEIKGDILNGNYRIENPPKGEYDVVIRGLPTFSMPPAAKDAPTNTAATDTAVSPPAKYAKPGSLPKLSVTGGNQTHNIELVP